MVDCANILKKTRWPLRPDYRNKVLLRGCVVDLHSRQEIRWKGEREKKEREWRNIRKVGEQGEG